MTSVTILAPTGMLGAGFGLEALERGMTLRPDAIAVDAGSQDPGPYNLGSGTPLYSDRLIKREFETLIPAARKAGIPLIVGSAGGAGTNAQVDRVVELVKEVAREQGLHFRLAKIYSDIPKDRVVAAIKAGEVRDLGTGFELTEQDVRAFSGLVAQMGDEPFRHALDQGADVVIAGRACDDSAIASFAIWKGADEALATHMGKILECGALSAEPFAMDVMLGTVDEGGFTLEPGSLARRASQKSVAAHSLYEREDPFVQHGPGRVLDLAGCRFEQLDQRRVRVSGTRGKKTSDYWIKLEAAKPVGYRTICMAGVRCPTMISRLDEVLEKIVEATHKRVEDPSLRIVIRKYGIDAVMRELEVEKTLPHEVGLLIETTASSQGLAHDACHAFGAKLAHAEYPGQKNISGNVAFPYSPRALNIGLQYEFGAYHLMKVKSALECFPLAIEEV
ncbi:acyclic terpene utilization AtuA family protein [Bradyrhizobium zhanjiangense]|uniref:Acyclic terpene utilization AtuA family protein n=1 Tax=Bradyrhizobium zhanjiangense TaxID=1325107 RepID=A0ABY0D8M7_9BRAD|nr:acyclic terpene utilization AtuA family protein [Bradyrhizobium zhanjiangense]RXG85304.1 acyclic terpene utilization AtuA family protein [Bradyrhizobium zhanjiangense]